MKRIYTIFSLIILLGIGTGCSDWLNIKPDSEIVLDDYWQNESQVNQVMAACYKSMTETSAMLHMVVWGELRSDNATYGIGIPLDMYQILNFDISPSNYYCEWGSMYATINYCNNLLHYAPGVVELDANFTESKLHSVEAEVKAIRALAYFYLVRTFGQVPWIEAPSIDDVQDYNIIKSDETVILNKLVDDLLFAIRYGRDEFDTNANSKGRFTKSGMRALLADIYLWQQKYSECVNMCDQVMADPNLELVEGEDVLTKVFSDGNSTESIFELQFDRDIQPNKVVYDFYGGYGDYYGWISFPAVLVTGDYSPFEYRVGTGYESEKDLREKDFLRQDMGGDQYFVFKYAGYMRVEDVNENSTYYYRNSTPNWIVYRLSDIMLMKAEALVQLETNSEEVIRLVNSTYMRSNIEDADSLQLNNYASKYELTKLVLRERQRELMFEGKRWFDLMRLSRRENDPAPLLSYVTKKFTGNSSTEYSKMSVMDALYLPIHTKELESNSALKQNPFYESLGEN